MACGARSISDYIASFSIGKRKEKYMPNNPGMRLPPRINDRVHVKHPDAYRPDGCEWATVVGIQMVERKVLGVRLCYILAYDNGYSDIRPWEDFWIAFE